MKSARLYFAVESQRILQNSLRAMSPLLSVFPVFAGYKNLLQKSVAAKAFTDILRSGSKAGSVLFLILNLVCGAPLSKAESNKLPTAVEETAKAVVKITATSLKGEFLLATGFAVKALNGEVFIATDSAIAREDIFHETSLNFQIEDISGGRILTDAYVAAFDIASDLALLKAPDYSGPVLPLFDFKDNKEPHYQLSFVSSEKDEEKGGWERGEWKTAPGLVPGKSMEEPTGELRYMEVFGLTADWKNSFYGYVHGINRRGGPLLNKNGAVAGVIFGHDRGYTVFGTKSSVLAKMLKNAKRGRPSNDSFAREMEKQITDMKSAAVAGDDEAAWTLARHYRHENEKEEYEKWRDLALKARNSRALYFAALDWLQLEEYEKAVPALREAADQGQSSAMFMLANALILGMEEAGIGKDLKAGVILMQKAAERQNPSAMENLAGMYLLGKGLPKDTAKGMDLLLDLARKGSKPAQEALERLHGPAWATLFISPGRGEISRCRSELFNGK